MEFAEEKVAIITGASGLLGREVFKLFMEKGWRTVGFAFSRAHANPNFVKVDITDFSEVERVVSGIKPSVIVHCAAERSPDVVEREPEKTCRLNVDATRNLSECADRHSAFFIYLSTDYVFDGENPPYNEDSTPNPLNEYGKSKLAGEKVTLEVNPSAAVLRVPVLYGQVEKLSESAVTVLFEKLLGSCSDEKILMSDYEQRYPTHTKDIALAILLLSSKRCEDKDFSIKGVYHWSGNERMTKFGMVMEMARIFELPMKHILPQNEPSNGAKRPKDAALSCIRIRKLGAQLSVPFSIGIKEVLQPFANKSK